MTSSTSGFSAMKGKDPNDAVFGGGEVEEEEEERFQMDTKMDTVTGKEIRIISTVYTPDCNIDLEDSHGKKRKQDRLTDGPTKRLRIWC